ncbi:MAG: YggS family pyridoxal phosphate-dependent enzyme [Gammaproteobacteria bacterium]|nr:YggS family pyridoxal phosphate-dependent enzyme [Gammaproteobacteria bacterium]
MSDLKNRLHTVRQRITNAEKNSGRASGSVHLLTVSKTCPADNIRACAALGQRCFGENQLQEALDKIEALADLALEWHFIGPIQSNKTRAIATHFHWAHSVDRLKIAQRLSAQRPVGMPPLNICLQVNISDEASKSGIPLDDVPSLVAALNELSGIRLRGLMAIPLPDKDMAQQRKSFRPLREMLESLNQAGYQLDTLSMGMSDDLEAAIAEGSTIVRVGSAIFGPRSQGASE